MEQAVWVAFSVIAVVIGFAIIVQLINTNIEDRKEISLGNSLIRLSKQCSFVCASPLDTLTPARVDLPSGLVLYTSEKRICGIYKNNTVCELCSCDVTMNGQLDLTTELARQFQTHSYQCTFLRVENGTRMECKG